MSSSKKNASGARNGEDAPLLADDATDGDAESNQAEDIGEIPWQEKIRHRLGKAWNWLQSNLMVVAIILLLLGGFIALCVYFAVMTKPDPEPAAANMCLTPACVLAASEILHNLSPKYQDLDPCNNFDHFVCEGWAEKTDLREDQDAAFTGTIMLENSQQILRHVLESPYPRSNTDFELDSVAKEKIFDKLHDSYEACMNEDAIKDLRSRPLLDILGQIDRIFPAKRPHDTVGFQAAIIQGQERVSSSALSNVKVYLATIGVSALIDFGAGADDKDPDVVIPFVMPPRQLGLPSKEYYRDSELVARYGDMIGKILEALLAESEDYGVLGSLMNRYRASSAELVESLVVFESQLAKATPDEQDAEDIEKIYNPLSVNETQALIPQLSIEYVISNLAPSGYSPEKIIVSSPSYLQNVSQLLQTTSAETLQAYFVWKTVQAYAYKIEATAVKPLKRFNNELQGKDPDASDDRWRACIRVADNSLGWILSKFFVEKAFSKQAKDFGDRIVYDIKDQFIKTLRHTGWMSKDVRDLGVEKVHNIVQKIGYPTKSPDIRDSSALNYYYGDINISSTAFFENAISVAKFDTKHEWFALGKPTNRDEWLMSAPTVNAYYNPAGNEIVFPAGIMQKPVFYDPSIPKYLSYGAFGSVSGHELSHAFDSTGRHYDKIGNYTDWWDKQTVEAFEEKANCFVDQYHEFTVPNPNGDPIHVNGRLTLGENIADAGGLNAAFAAWKQMEDEEPEQILPGLQHFSKEQVFFISYANWWCGKTRPEAAVNRVYRDPHSPNWVRILGTVSNSRYFRETFDCPTKEPTCELW